MANYSAEFSGGLIAGGMNDGTINLWDPSKLMASHPQAQLGSMKHHTGAVSGLHFNPTAASNHLLASGGADSTVLIHALDRPDTPKQPFVPAPDPGAAKHTAEVSRVAWNTQVPHILASAAANGSCHVWDLRQKKSWCELRDAKKGSISDICWNPTEGLQLVTAMGDDSSPVINMWDLRSSTTMPLAQLQGHTQGILSMSWCPTDTSLLLSCGKDSKTFVWDLYERRPVYEISAEEPQAAPGGGGFGGFGMAGRRYEVAWAPKQRAVLSACSFDRKVQVYSMNGVRTASAKAPTWSRRPCGAAFGFGGKLVTFNDAPAPANQAQQQPGIPVPRPFSSTTVVEDSGVVAASVAFEASLEAKDFKGLCEVKAAASEEKGAGHEASVWRFVQLVFEDSARSKLLLKLGFDAEQIAAEVKALGLPPGASAPAAAAEPSPSSPSGSGSGDSPSGLAPSASAEDFFGGGDAAPAEAEVAPKEDDDGTPTDDLAAVSLSETPEPSPVAAEATTPTEEAAVAPVGAAEVGGEEATEVSVVGESEAVKRALLVGNFSAAVDGCFKRGQLADALLLASCGGAELWETTRVRYFEAQAAQRPYLNMVAAIIHSRLGDLVATSELGEWKQTLAILSTYGKTDEFSSLCEQLGARLEEEAKDAKAASLCYLCAINVPKTVQIWIDELKEQAAKLGRVDSMLLHALVEKVTVFTQGDNDNGAAAAAAAGGAAAPGAAAAGGGGPGNLGPAMADLFTQYGALLANQGQMVTATKYLGFSMGSPAANELRHRLFFAAQMDRTGAPHPASPFEAVTVGVSPNSGVASLAALPSGGGGGAPAAGGVGGAAAAFAGGAPSAEAAFGAGPGTAAAALAAATPAAPAVATEAVDPNTGLPVGWIWQTDPGSGRVYYVNTMTGVTQWEPPTPAPAPAPAPVAPVPVAAPAAPAPSAVVPQPAPHIQPAAAAPAPAPHTTPQPPASSVTAGGAPMAPSGAKYDGFKSGPGPKSAAYVPPKPSGGGGEVPATPVDASSLPAELAPMVPALQDLQARLAAVCVAAAEKKQLAEVGKASAILLDKIGQGAIEAAVSGKAMQLVMATATKDYAAASAIHKDLTATAWDQHKDWIKGIKSLFMLCQRKNV
jgi:protein transport protein SEC31